MFSRNTCAIACLLLFVFSFSFLSQGIAAESEPDFRTRISTKPRLLSEDDVRAEIQFGREMASRILGRYGFYNNETITRYVNLVAAALALNLNRPELSFHVAVLKTDTINAYAAPGGYIFITRGALMQMHDEAELAAVIAHEMAHIANRHIVKELNIHASDTSPVSGFARFLGASGDPAKMTFLNMVDKAMDILFENGYKLEDEKDADSSAAMYLAMAGYDPMALVDYLDRIEELKGVDMKVLEKTHPSFKDRIRSIKSSIDDEGLKEAGGNKRATKRFNSTIAIKPHELTGDDILAEIRFGREVAARLLGKFGHLDKEELTKYLTMVGMSIALNMNRPEIEFRVAVLDTDEVATFSAPGGYIFITKGALAMLDDEAELAAAIANEMSHVANRSMLREVNIHGTKEQPAAGFSRLVGTGDEEASEALLSQADRAMGILLDQGYRTEYEKTADSSTIALLEMSGYDPSAFIRYLEALGSVKKEKIGVMNLTHSLPKERIVEARGVIKEEGLDQGKYKRGAERFNEYKKIL